MVKTSEIKAQMLKLGTTQEEVAQKLGIDSSLLNKKMNNEEGECLTVKEVNKIILILKLPRDQLTNIFFI